MSLFVLFVDNQKIRFNDFEYIVYHNQHYSNLENLVLNDVEKTLMIKSKTKYCIIPITQIKMLTLEV